MELYSVKQWNHMLQKRVYIRERKFERERNFNTQWVVNFFLFTSIENIKLLLWVQEREKWENERATVFSFNIFYHRKFHSHSIWKQNKNTVCICITIVERERRTCFKSALVEVDFFVWCKIIKIKNKLVHF